MLLIQVITLLIQVVILLIQPVIFSSDAVCFGSLHFLRRFETGIKIEKRNDKADRGCEKLRDYDRDEGGGLGIEERRDGDNSNRGEWRRRKEEALALGGQPIHERLGVRLSLRQKKSGRVCV